MVYYYYPCYYISIIPIYGMTHSEPEMEWTESIEMDDLLADLSEEDLTNIMENVDEDMNLEVFDEINE